MNFFCVGVMYSGEQWCLLCYSECISTPDKLEKYAWPRWESNLRPLEYQPNALPTELRGQVGSSMRYFGTEFSSFDIDVI